MNYARFTLNADKKLVYNHTYTHSLFIQAPRLSNCWDSRLSKLEGLRTSQRSPESSHPLAIYPRSVSSRRFFLYTKLKA